MARLQSSAKIPFRVSPMLATLVPRPFHKPNWVYEQKYDGIRILAYKEGDKLSLITRNDIDRVSDFPNLAAAIRHLKSSTLLLDGEVVVFDKENVSNSCNSEAVKRNMRSLTASLRMAETCGRSR
jgi:bifunctional non-homologous end joining protein LigD